MKKYVIALIVLLAIFGCEKDDICIEANTPNLIIRFYDAANPTQLKQVTNMYVWALNKDSIYQNVALDSIVIPLDINANTTTYFISSDLGEDEIELNYTKKDIFVSRSCGYKTIFENLQVANNTVNWINSISINNSTIEDESKAHLHIYH